MSVSLVLMMCCSDWWRYSATSFVCFVKCWLVVIRHKVFVNVWAYIALVVSFLVRRAAADSRSLFGHEDFIP